LIVFVMSRASVVVMIFGSGFVGVSGDGGMGMGMIGGRFSHRATAQRRQHQH
jgi:hypothetical protein